MDFSRIAPFYRWMEYLTFAGSLQERRLAFLQDVAESKRVLVLGDGDGRFAAAYLKRERQATATTLARLEFVDCSPGMVQLAKKRVGELELPPGVVSFSVLDVREAVLTGPYDLVVSHFFLDCFSTGELKSLIPRISAAMAPDARWLVSEFAIPSRNPWRWSGSALIRTLYFFFRHTTGLRQTELPDYQGVLGRGFYLAKLQSAGKGLLVSQLWSRKPTV